MTKTIHINEKEHYYLKIYALKHKTTIKNVVEEFAKQIHKRSKK